MLREKVRKVLRHIDKEKNSKPKIEYYRRGECPRSKYRGPVDPEHRRRLYEWTFAGATADRRRSFDLELSPCTSVPERPHNENDDTSAGEDNFASESEPETREIRIQIRDPPSFVDDEDRPSGSFDSDQSTAVTSSFRSSSQTLKDSCDWPMDRRDAIYSLKEAVIYSDDTRRMSTTEKRLSFDPQDLSVALSAVRMF